MEIKDLKPILGIPAHTGVPIIIAGPCSAESEEQTLSTARQLVAGGIRIFRAGVWKPRTKPGGFEGKGSIALHWLKKVKDETGMVVTTEIANHKHLAESLDAGLDALWIGARTSTNPFAVQEIADTLSRLSDEEKDRITILIKNPVNPDLELWIGAVERIYGSGIRRIGVIHRGFSSYGSHLYRNQPRWAIPIELKRRIPNLPIILDPSHIGGRRDLIASLSQRGIDMNYDGLIIESHCSPEDALSDAAQQITPRKLIEIINSLSKRSDTASTKNLDQLRRQIDELDDELMELLAKRMKVSREIGSYKKTHKIPVVQNARYKTLMERRVADSEKLEMSPDFVRTILASIHEESVRQQVELRD